MTGLLIGLVIGLVVAAGFAWYLNEHGTHFKEVESPEEKAAQKAAQKAEQKAAAETDGKVAQDSQAARQRPAAEAVQPTAPATARPPEPAEPKPLPAPATESSPAPPKPKVDYTFYGILPANESNKPALPKPMPSKSNDVWWLQVAALKNPADADKLKARLALLGLNVTTQKIEAAGGISLYRIRVGPYKREDEAFGDLDTLAENNFEPRLFKDPSPPPKQ
jgi:cell division protein FtsN